MTESRVKQDLHEAIPDTIPDPSLPVQAKTMLYRKMADAMSRLERLPKNGYNKFHKYTYVTDADVMDALRSTLAGVGLAFSVSVVNVVRDAQRVTVEVALTLADADTGETITSVWFGEANDRKGTDDKAIQKAVTAAVKYFLLKAFLVSTGDEAQDTDSGVDDARQTRIPSPPPRKRPATRAELEERWEDLWRQAHGLGLDPDSLPTISPDGTDDDLVAAGKALAAIVAAALEVLAEKEKEEVGETNEANDTD